MQWATTWVFFSFSCIFGCSLTVFSVHLDASHWNLEFFGFTQTTFFVHPKKSRFQCSPSSFTEKTLSSQPKIQEKLNKTSGCSLHSFLQHRKYFADGKWLEKNNFWWLQTFSSLHCKKNPRSDVKYHLSVHEKCEFMPILKWNEILYLLREGLSLLYKAAAP